MGVAAASSARTAHPIDPVTLVTQQVSPRLSEPLAPEILDLVFRPRIERELGAGIDDLCAVNEAHLVMLERMGLVSASDAARLARALATIRGQGVAAIPRDPSREDGYFNFETALLAQAGAEAGGRLHIARSRNDINATLDRLAMRSLLAEMIAATLDLRGILKVRALSCADMVMPGYTHLQLAQPITFGFYLAGIGTALARDTTRLFHAYEAANSSPLGACAFAGTSFATDRDLLADLLGFDTVRLHAQDAVASRDYAWDAALAMLSLASTWGRFAQDLYVWATPEFGLISFPDSIAGISSIMPQKKNPIAVEYLKSASGEVLGGLTATFTILKGGHFSHAGDTSRGALAPLWPSLRLCLNALKIAGLVAARIEPRAEAMASRASDGFSTATDLADELVRQCGLSFRRAHHVVADLVRDALVRGLAAKDLHEADLHNAFERVTGRVISVDAAGLLAVLDPGMAVRRRQSAGSASPAETRKICATLAQDIARDGDELQARQSALAGARQRLAQHMRALISVGEG